MEKENYSRKVPGWFKVLILITALPIFAWPWLMSRATETFTNSGTDNSLPWAFVMLLPLYVVLSTWISYRVYASRREVSWILQGLQILVYIAMAMLVA
ncbi:hypothetical protein [Barnesiella sp. An55]|uniref:hypothetical protein n=1 Tax=Barnesiella sp. An55 TaxID=1965646 RepID=UPI000B37946D|nr:hypothetical protein [Barnesiella sp. An55]OUN69764.1 hypothetical protein B5G10_11285 [Barnesiella sp. An55]HIZ25552.1 hypothetical protein [Candidatus Barnesiella merdipullorum]